MTPLLLEPVRSQTTSPEVLEQRKFPERTRLLEELPPLLREQVLLAAAFSPG